MLRIILIISIFILSIGTISAQKKHESKFTDGQIKEIGYFDKAGLRDSTWILYNENGKIVQEAYYVHGVKSGFWRTYYENGSIMFIIPYVNGIKQGEALQYSEDGNLIASKKY